MVSTTTTPTPFKPIGTKCGFDKHAKCKRGPVPSKGKPGWCTCACHLST